MNLQQSHELVTHVYAELLVPHLPLDGALPDLTAVLDGPAHDVPGLPLLVSVLLYRRILGQVDTTGVEVGGIVIPKYIKLKSHNKNYLGHERSRGS